MNSTGIAAFFAKIADLINVKLNKFGSLVAPDGNFTIYKYVVGGLFVIAFFLITYHLGRNNVIKQAYQSSVEKLIKNKINNAKDIKKIRAKKENPIATYFNNKFVYSRIDKYIKFMTPGLWFGFIAAVFFITLVVLLALKADFIVAFAFAILAGFIPFIIELIMAHSNYKKIDKQLIEFLNMLGNFSSQNTEITEVLSHVYPRMEEPLSSILEESIYEAENLGTETAMINLSRKIEHPKFKEIIQNLRVAQKYSASFKAVVDNNNASLLDYIRQKKERDHLATFNMITLILVIIIAIAIFYVLGGMIDVDIFTYLFTNTNGQIALAIAFACVGFFVWKIYTIDK